MESWFEYGLNASRWLQVTYPQIHQLMALISDLGRFEFYLAVLPLIYWCFDKQLGKHLTYLLALSDLTNQMLKHSFRMPRPFWLDEGLGLGEEGGYGIPSGHVQSATVFYLMLASWFRRRWLWWLGAALIFLMILSRIYLGDHFIHDTVAGLLIGLVFLLGYWIWRQRMSHWLGNRILGQRLLIAIAIFLAFTSVYLVLLVVLGEPTGNAAWQTYYSEAELESMSAVASRLGILLGLGVGLVLERSWVRFRVEGTVAHRVARYVLGIIVTIAIWRGLGIAFASIEPLWLALPLRTLRYLLLGLWATYYAPAVFVRLRLAATDPEPQIKIKI